MARRSAEDLELVWGGARAEDLAVMFDHSVPEVKRRLIGRVPPVNSDGSPRWRIRDAAPYLCNVVFDPEEFLKNISPQKLPPALNKAFWQGLRERQKYEEERGHLWSTQRVIEVLATAFKNVRMTGMMMSDRVEQMSELTQAQRVFIQKEIDSMLSSTRQALVEEFQSYVPAQDEHGAPPEGVSAEPPHDDGFGDIP